MHKNKFKINGTPTSEIQTLIFFLSTALVGGCKTQKRKCSFLRFLSASRNACFENCAIINLETSTEFLKKSKRNLNFDIIYAYILTCQVVRASFVLQGILITQF